MTIEPALNHIIQGDCRTVLPTLPANSVDMVFADPPYNLQLRQELWRPNNTQVDAVNDAWDRFDSNAAYDTFTREWLTAVRRVMKPTATIWVSGTYHNIFRVGTILQDLDFWILNTVSWFKRNAMPNFRGTRLKNDVEFVIWAKYDEHSRYTFHHQMMKQFNNEKQLGSVWQIPVCGGPERLKNADGKKLHSTQKPEELLKRIILASSTPGDVILDPFMGSGTTAVAAQRLRRQWLGVEKETAYIKAAQDRLTAVEPLPEDDPLITAALHSKPPRIPFARLLALGYLQVGQSLYLDKPTVTAVILENGRLQVNGDTGSIHQLGSKLKGTPSCNGWMHWRYQDEATGEYRPLDNLRQIIRQQQANSAK